MTGFDRSTPISVATIPEQQCDPLHAKKMAALGELASGITHDFGNVLQTLVSTLELIESRSDDPAEVRRLAASGLRAADRGIRLSRRLLRFSRHEAPGAKPVCLVSSLESITEMLARTVEARMNVGIKSLAADLWPVVIDPNAFELALINVGLNARDAMPNGGRIEIAARNVSIPCVDRRAAAVRARPALSDRRGPLLALPGGDYVAVSVADTGSGMDEATLARAAEPFFTTKAAGRGTGLGLASVRDLATVTHGALRLRSELGRGTTVELWFPRAQPAAAAPGFDRTAEHGYPIRGQNGAVGRPHRADLAVS